MTANAVVYLKPLGANETRATQDGSSWATAYSNVSDAVTAALKTDEPTVYAAAGVYVVSETQKLTKSVKICGGFAGASADETLASRDLANNETIFTGDIGGDDVWKHYVLNTNDNTVAETELTDKPVLVDGQFSPPPAYTDDYDIYAPAIKGTNLGTMFKLAASCDYVFDGILFMSFNGQLFPDVGGELNSLTIKDCKLLAYQGSGESPLYARGGTSVMQNVRFAYAKQSCSSIYVRSTVLTMKDCSFESLYATDNKRGTIFFHYTSNNEATVLDGVSFDRIGRRCSVWTAYGSSAVLFADESHPGPKTFRNCVVRNCYGVSTSAESGAIPLILTRQNGLWDFEGCRFSKNYIGCYVKRDGFYTMIGSWTGKAPALYNGCVFDDNTVRAYQGATAEGRAGVGIVGSSCDGCQDAFVNCVFDRNSADVSASLAAWDVTRSQGVLAGSINGSTWSCAANCTFRSKGDAGVADIAIYGVSLKKPVNVVNCLFMSDADVATPFAAPDGLTSANGLCVWNATAQNVVDVPDCVASDGGGWQSDAVPFAEGADGVLTPAAKTPGIRETGDVALYVLAAKATLDVRFRPSGEETWRPLCRDAILSDEATLIGDIASLATPRTAGAFTRGAKQALSDAAESGTTLTLRRSPLKGGTLDGPSAQAVASGASATSVTAVPMTASGVSFAGWYTTDGSLYSQDATLSVASLDADLVLVAKFATPSVTLTFDLGSGGTFTENGASTITLAKNAGEVLAIPVYTVADGWYVEGFGEVPDVVPMTNATYAASVLTTAARVFHVVPTADVPAGSDKTGSSWANATDDIAAAIKDAARYRGELWLKGGVYDVASSLDLRSNVGVYGGFAGTETSRDQAGSTANPTILTGDKRRNDVWSGKTGDGKTASIGEQKLFDYETWTFNAHDPNEDGVVWHADNNSVSGDNTMTCFTTEQRGAATNCVLSGLTFLSFGKNVVFVDEMAYGASVTLADCTICGCGFRAGTVPVETYGSVCVTNCQFVGNRAGVATRGSGASSVIADCTFKFSEAIDSDRTVVYLNSAQPTLVTNCTFVANPVLNASYVLRAASANNRIADCRFERNCRTGGYDSWSSGDLKFRCSAMLYSSQPVTFSRCQFVGNTNALAAGDMGASTTWLASLFRINGNNIVVRDSLFERNSTSFTKTSGTLKGASVALVENGSNISFLNCTMKDNAVVATTDAGDVAASVIMNYRYVTTLAFVHCTLAGSALTGGTKTEIYQDSAGDNANRPLVVLNSVLDNTDAAYCPIVQKTAQSPLLVASSHLSNAATDGSGYDLTRANSLWRDVTSADPKLTGGPSKDATGLRAWGVSGSSPLKAVGVRTYLKDGLVYFYDAGTNAAKPWRRTSDPSWYSADAGLTDASLVIPDAFGRARNPAKIAAGPLLPTAAGFMLFVR